MRIKGLRWISFWVGMSFSFVSVAFATSLSVNQYIEKLIAVYIPHTQVGVVLLDPKSNKVLFQKNANQLFTPASNIKLFTASAALLGLGLNYRYKTILGYQQEQLKNHVLLGNVYLHFSGDPSFRIKDLNYLLKRLKMNGVKKIQGNIILDGSYFSKPNHSPGLSFEDLNWHYAAPVSSIILNKNRVTAFFHPGKKIGDSVSVEEGQGMAYMSLSHQIKTVSYDQAEHHCSLLLSVNDENHISLGGCWPVYGAPSEVNFAVKNTFLFAAKALNASLQKNRIIFTGKILKGQMPADSKEIVHFSKPLSGLIQTMLKHSNNLYAEAITKTLGKKYFGHGTLQEGVNAIQKILKNKWGLSFRWTKLYDGEGTRYDLASPYALATLLSHIYHDKALYPIILASLPRSHTDDGSTLKHFLSFRFLPANVYAKTGTLNDASALSGYLKTKQHKTLIFSIIVNHDVRKLKWARKLQVKLCELFYQNF